MGAVSVRDGEGILGTHSGDSYITLGSYLMPLNCTRKSGQNGKFYVYVYFTTVKKLILKYFPGFSYER